MQLNKHERVNDRRRKRAQRQRIGGSLAAATCALLGPGTATTVIAQELEPWVIDTAMLYYGESDGRVKDFSVNGYARKELREDSFLTLTMAFDSLTGASPSGAVPSPNPQTFTRPSGNDSYVIAPGATPLDDTFHDQRTAFSAGWQWPMTRLATVNVGASVSDEFDYTHTGVNAGVARDFNNRNTTLSFGVSLANDTINPIGGVPVGMSSMLGVGDHANKRGDETKDVVDILIGVTQVLNRQSIVQFNYSLSQSDGYLTDPFKILSVVDPISGLPVAGPVGSGLNDYVYENRPGTRDKQSVFGLFKRDFDGNVFDISYRYMTDDWDIDSHTVDLHYKFRIGENGRYLQPHLRFYSQTQANFYSTALFDGNPLPQYASADYRLGEFDAITLGIKYGQETRNGEFDARIEVYQQTGTPSANAAVGALAGFDLYPDLNAVIAQFGYKFGR